MAAARGAAIRGAVASADSAAVPRATYSALRFGEPGYPAEYRGAFRDNVTALAADVMQREPEGIEGHPTWSLLLTITRAEAYSQPPFTPFEALSHPPPSAVSADPLSPSARSPPPPATPRAQARGDVSSAPELSAGNSAAGALCATAVPAELPALLGAAHAAQQQAQLQGAAHPAQQVLLPLLLVAEATEGSANPHCDYCRSSGWCHHPIATHKYHFIIPAKNPHSHPRAETQVLATTASNISPHGTRSTTSTSNPHPSSHHNQHQHHHTRITAAACRSQSLASPTHLLHGVIHTNGFGHLVTLNGRAAGSHVLSGQQLMQLWDNICTMLRARVVSVEDLSHKLSFSSDYRLLHTLAFSHSWFARWSYSFVHGAFGITQQRYNRAVARVAGTRLLPLLQHLRGINTGIASRVAAVVAKYQSHVLSAKCQPQGEYQPHVSHGAEEVDDPHPHASHVPHAPHGPHGPHAAPPNLTLQYLFSSLLALRSSLPLPLHHQHHHFPHLLHPSSLPLPFTPSTPAPPTAPSTPAAAAAPLAAVPSLASSRSPLLSFSARRLLAPPPPLTLPPLFPPLQPMAARQLSGEPSPTSASCLSDELSPRQQQQRLLRQQQQQALPSPPIIISPLPADSPSCRWSSKRLHLAQQVIVDVLSLRPGAWLPRHEVREAARQRIGDTGLLDFVLKSLGNRLVGDVVVRRVINPLSKVLEFSLEPLQREGGERGGGGRGEGRDGVVGEEGRGGMEGQQGEVPMGVVSPLTLGGAVDSGGDQLRADVTRDVEFLYKHLLFTVTSAHGHCHPHQRMHQQQRQQHRQQQQQQEEGQRETKADTTSSEFSLSAFSEAVQTILDTKQFFKDYKGELTREQAARAVAAAAGGEGGEDGEERDGVSTESEEGDGTIRVLCSIDARDADTNRNWPIPPPELITLPPEATVADLKAAACRAFAQTYPVARHMQVTALPTDLEDLDDDDVLFGSLDSGASLLLAISNLDAHGEWRYEGGNDTWAVRCVCGARDDDGERMIACDECGVWQHTRCAGIGDAAPAPMSFLCLGCRAGEKDHCREFKVDCGEKKGARRVVKSKQVQGEGVKEEEPLQQHKRQQQQQQQRLRDMRTAWEMAGQQESAAGSSRRGGCKVQQERCAGQGDIIPT
ncbi:unnamed protein product [Closterium sp. Naga37s-1]|nr:unnamed protein product [Closterium sp. Naga37s-1]